MYNFSLYSSFLNKFIALFVTITLLFVSFSFRFEANLKQELNNLYEATSVCEYYNTITNFSYGIINKILESTNINLTTPVSQNDKAGKKEEPKNNQDNLYFVKSTNERESANIKTFNYSNIYLYDILLSQNIYSSMLLNKIFLKFHIFKISHIPTIFCYLARGNIDDIIKINNILKDIRFV